MNESFWGKHRRWIWPMVLFSGPLSLLLLFIGHARHYTYIKINIFLSLLIALYVWLVAGNRPVESSLTVFDIIGNPFSSPASEEMTYGAMIMWIIYGAMAGCVLGAYAAMRKYALPKRYFYIPLSVFLAYTATNTVVYASKFITYARTEIEELNMLFRRKEGIADSEVILGYGLFDATVAGQNLAALTDDDDETLWEAEYVENTQVTFTLKSGAASSQQVVGLYFVNSAPTIRLGAARPKSATIYLNGKRTATVDFPAVFEEPVYAQMPLVNVDATDELVVEISAIYNESTTLAMAELIPIVIK